MQWYSSAVVTSLVYASRSQTVDPRAGFSLVGAWGPNPRAWGRSQIPRASAQSSRAQVTGPPPGAEGLGIWLRARVGSGFSPLGQVMFVVRRGWGAIKFENPWCKHSLTAPPPYLLFNGSRYTKGSKPLL